MSLFRSSSSTMAPENLALTNAVRTQFANSAVTLCSSAELSTLAATLGSPDDARTALPAAARLLTDSRLTGLAAAAGPDTAARLTSLRVQLGSHGGYRLGGEAVDAARLFGDLAPVLAREERTVVADIAVETLEDLGYTVIEEAGPHAVGVEARRGHEVMLLAVTEGGEVHADHVGADGACGERQARFEAGMAARGVVLRTRTVTPHDDDAGPLVTAAAGARESNLARAVARNTRAPRVHGARSAAARGRVPAVTELRAGGPA